MTEWKVYRIEIQILQIKSCKQWKERKIEYDKKFY